MSHVQILHNLLLGFAFFPGVHGNFWLVSPSTNLFMRVAANGGTRCNHSQDGMHSALFHFPRRDLFSRAACCVYTIASYDICWHWGMFDMVCLEKGSLMLSDVVEREKHGWFAFLPNQQHAGGESKQITFQALNPCDVILLCCADALTDWWENVWRRRWYPSWVLKKT